MQDRTDNSRDARRSAALKANMARRKAQARARAAGADRPAADDDRTGPDGQAGDTEKDG